MTNIVWLSIDTSKGQSLPPVLITLNLYLRFYKNNKQAGSEILANILNLYDVLSKKDKY